MPSKLSRSYAIVTLTVIVVIAYGSLYPFDFSVPVGASGPVQHLLSTWANRPGRGDFLANILLYMPLGLFSAVAFTERARPAYRLLVSMLLGAGVSISLELAQYYDVGRDSDLTDVYANLLGTTLGSLAGMIFDRSRWRSISDIAVDPIPALLVLDWSAYRLYPFVPTIDLHKYWSALKPILLTPSLSGYDFFRHTAIWLAVFALLSKIRTALGTSLLIPLFAGFVLLSKIFIVSTTLSVAEVVGAVAAYLIWVVLHTNRRAYLAVVIVLFGATVIAQRLEPFQFSAEAAPFSWMPFRSFMYGSIEVDVMSFLEKFFLYGTLIWCLVEVGLGRLASAGFVVAALFATSAAETYLPRRSAEITDAIMAIVIAAMFSLISRGDAARGSRCPQRSPTPPVSHPPREGLPE